MRRFLTEAGREPEECYAEAQRVHGPFEFGDEAGILHGEVLDLRDVITFQGRSVEELERAFRDSVDYYLEFCEERGEEPEKPRRKQQPASSKPG